MISFTEAHLNAWVAGFFFPLARILALLAAAPAWSSTGVPVAVKVGLGVAITVALLPVLPPQPAIAPASGIGLAVLVQQILIGTALGFAMRLVFAAVDMAGELIGLEMGLSFASFYDRDSGGQTAVLGEFIGITATLVFLSLNGHLALLAVLSESFHVLPISTTPLAGATWSALARAGATVFSAGLLLALPIIAALLMTNIALGVLTRAAPQLNLFNVGFPVTLTVGLAMVGLGMPYFAPAFERLFDGGLATLSALLRVAAGG
ncbi:MAG: flagellar biosynthetic protein FliR [Betaproteobacteria bacterium]|nr:flagellar biosynthetic protein FliR [Betaproteobacteria bacterium]